MRSRKPGTGSSGVDGGRRSKHMPRGFSVVEAVDRIIKERDDAVAAIEDFHQYVDKHPGGLIGKTQIREALPRAGKGAGGGK